MHLKEIWRYPVKSCGGAALSAAILDEYGVEGDRQFVVVGHGGELLTQRNAPRLNLISVHNEPDRLRLGAPGVSDIEVDTSAACADAEVILYDGPAPGQCLGSAAADWLSGFLGRPARLLKSHKIFGRRMPPQVGHLFLPEQRRYPDCAPLHLIGVESLGELNMRLPEPVAMSQFRPNLVIEGLGAFAEDRLRSLRIGDVVLDYMGLAERCAIPSIKPGAVQRGLEPLRALRSYRMAVERIYTGVVFGAYFKLRRPGELRVGDPIEVLSTGKPPPSGRLRRRGRRWSKARPLDPTVRAPRVQARLERDPRSHPRGRKPR